MDNQEEPRRSGRMRKATARASSPEPKLERKDSAAKEPKIKTPAKKAEKKSKPHREASQWIISSDILLEQQKPSTAPKESPLKANSDEQSAASSPSSAEQLHAWLEPRKDVYCPKPDFWLNSDLQGQEGDDYAWEGKVEAPWPPAVKGTIEWVPKLPERKSHAREDGAPVERIPIPTRKRKRAQKDSEEAKPWPKLLPLLDDRLTDAFQSHQDSFRGLGDLSLSDSRRVEPYPMFQESHERQYPLSDVRSEPSDRPVPSWVAGALAAKREMSANPEAYARPYSPPPQWMEDEEPGRIAKEIWRQRDRDAHFEELWADEDRQQQQEAPARASMARFVELGRQQGFDVSIDNERCRRIAHRPDVPLGEYAHEDPETSRRLLQQRRDREADPKRRRLYPGWNVVAE